MNVRKRLEVAISGQQRQLGLATHCGKHHVNLGKRTAGLLQLAVCLAVTIGSVEIDGLDADQLQQAFQTAASRCRIFPLAHTHHEFA